MCTAYQPFKCRYNKHCRREVFSILDQREICDQNKWTKWLDMPAKCKWKEKKGTKLNWKFNFVLLLYNQHTCNSSYETTLQTTSSVSQSASS